MALKLSQIRNQRSVKDGEDFSKISEKKIVVENHLLDRQGDNVALAQTLVQKPATFCDFCYLRHEKKRQFIDKDDHFRYYDVIE